MQLKRNEDNATFDLQLLRKVAQRFKEFSKKCANTLSQNSIFAWVPVKKRLSDVAFLFRVTRPVSRLQSLWCACQKSHLWPSKKNNERQPLSDMPSHKNSNTACTAIGYRCKIRCVCVCTTLLHYIIVWPMNANVYSIPYSAQSFSTFLHLPLRLEFWRTRLLQVVNSLCQSRMMPPWWLMVAVSTTTRTLSPWLLKRLLLAPW